VEDRDAPALRPATTITTERRCPVSADVLARKPSSGVQTRRALSRRPTAVPMTTTVPA
jgi:hypothetical protein